MKQNYPKEIEFFLSVLCYLKLVQEHCETAPRKHAKEGNYSLVVFLPIYALVLTFNDKRPCVRCGSLIFHSVDRVASLGLAFHGFPSQFSLLYNVSFVATSYLMMLMVIYFFGQSVVGSEF